VPSVLAFLSQQLFAVHSCSEIAKNKVNKKKKGFLEKALAHVMSVAGPIPALASVSVLQSAPVGGSVVGVVGPL